MQIEKDEIPGRIRQFAKLKKLKLIRLAKLLDMLPQSLNSSYLSGRSIPGPEILVKFHNIGCNIVWLLTGEGKPLIADPQDSESLDLEDEELRKDRLFKALIDELTKAKAENAAFRKAFTPEMINLIFSEFKEPDRNDRLDKFPLIP